MVLRLALVIALLPACASGSSVPGEAPRPARGPAPAGSSTSAAPATAPAAPPAVPSATASAPMVDEVRAASAPPTAGEADPAAAPSTSAPAAPPSLGPTERAVLRAVESNPTVRALCADSARQGGPCVIYVDQPGEGACPPGLALVHPCLWTVVIASNMGTHTSRRGTMLVRPDGVVVAAANLFCPPMALAAWERVERASLAGTPVDDCPDAVGDAPGAPATSP